MEVFTARHDVLAVLKDRVARLEGAAAPADDRPLSTGVPALDHLLPAGGLRRGTLVEYLADGTLALGAAREACRQGRALVVSDRRRTFYPPAAAAWGIDLASTIVLQPASIADERRAVDQTLRCPGVGAVWVRLGILDPREFRRLQLAAEAGGTVGLLVRSASVRGWPTWSDVQWLIQPQPSPGPWRLRVELLRCRGGPGGRSVLLELDEPTRTWREAHAHPLPALAELADPAAARRQSTAYACRPLILHARDPRRGELVTACNSAAAAQGVRPALPLAEAAALIGAGSRPCFLPHEPLADLTALARLAEHCERFSPLVGWETVGGPADQSQKPRPNSTGPDSLQLDITGIGVLFGGEETLAHAAGADLAQLGFVARPAIAGTIGAAWRWPIGKMAKNPGGPSWTQRALRFALGSTASARRNGRTAGSARHRADRAAAGLAARQFDRSVRPAATVANRSIAGSDPRNDHPPSSAAAAARRAGAGVSGHRQPSHRAEHRWPDPLARQKVDSAADGRDAIAGPP